MEESRPPRKPLAFSRRGFFALTGALVASSSLPFWEGVYARAYASEAGSTAFKIYVAKRWEVPVSFLDMADPSDPGSVVGAQIKITSHDTEKTVEATTDDLGIALVDVRDLVSDENKNLIPANYSFYGSVSVTAEGYREFEAGVMAIDGGVHLEIPTQRLDGRPYLKSLTVAGWDIQYANETSFPAGESNRDACETAATIVGEGYSSAKVALYQESGFRLEQTAKFADGAAKVTLSSPLFSLHADDAGKALALNEAVYFTVDFPQDAANSFVVTTSLRAVEGSGGDASQEDGAYSISEMVSSPGTVVPVSLPADFPFLGGEAFKIEKLFPAIPLTFNYNPAGFIVIGAGVPASFGGASKNWNTKTVQDVAQKFANIGKEWSSFFNNVKSQNANPANADSLAKRTFGRQPLSKSFALDFEGGGLIALQWLIDEESGEVKSYQGSLAMYGSLAAKCDVKQQVNVSFVPLFILLEGSVTASFIAELPILYSLETKKLTLAPGASTELRLKPRVAVSLGVGLVDVLSVAVRGAGQLTFTMDIEEPEAASESDSEAETKDSRHMTVGASADVSVVLQVALFKASYQLWKVSEPSLYDSWNESAQLRSAQESADRSAFYVRLPDGSVGFSATPGSALKSRSQGAAFFASNSVGVTSAELASTIEFKASAGVARGASGGYVYESVPRNGLKTSDSAVKALTADGAAIDGGVVYEDVFSDPRMRVVSVGGTPWLFRILTVAYAGNQVRTRLAVAKWTGARWGETQVLDFAPEVMLPEGDERTIPERLDQYDYDFSVVSADATLGSGSTWADGSAVRIFLTSGARPSGEGTTLGEAMAHTLGTFITLDASAQPIKALCYPDTYLANPISSTDASSPCMFVNPRIFAAKDSGGESVTAVFAFCRRADSQDALVNGPYEEYPATAFFGSDGAPLGSKFGFVYANVGSMRPMASGGEDPKTFIADVKHSVAVGPYQMNVAGSNFASICVHYVTDGSDGRVVKSFLVLRYVSMLDEPGETVLLGASGAAQFVHSWLPAGTGGALCSTPDGMVAKSLSSNPTAVTSQNVSLSSGVSLESFALDEATSMLYYATSFDGIDHDTGEAVQDYRIWASHYVDFDGSRVFLDPFPLLQTDQPVDSFEFVDLGDAYGFAVNSIVNMQDSMSRVLFYSVPYVKHAELEGFGSVNPTVCAGEEELFNVTLRNTGNVLLSAVTLEITAGEAKETVSLDLTSEKVKAFPVLGDVIELDGELDAESGETVYGSASMDALSQTGVLIPGKARVYQFAWSVPESLRGSVDVQVRVVTDDTVQVAPLESGRLQAAVHAGTLGIESAAVDGALSVVAAGTSQEGEPSVQKSRYRYGNEPEPDPGTGGEGGGASDGSGESAGQTSGEGKGSSNGPGSGAASDDKLGFAATNDSLSATASAALLAAVGVAGVTAAVAKAKAED